MRRMLLVVFLGFTGLALLAAVGAGVFLAFFDPNAYTERISDAVEAATGRRLQFQGDVVTSFFPTPSLKTGRLVMNDPGTFGGGAFVTVESATVALAVKPFLQGIVHIEEIILDSPVAHLVTTAAGQNNWDYGFVFGRPKGGESPPGFTAEDSAGVVPLADPVQADSRQEGFFSRMVIQAERISCRDGRVFYRDLGAGLSYAGVLDDMRVESVRRNADVPFAATGGLRDESGVRTLRFSLKGAARLADSGDFSARFDSCDLTLSGLAAKPVVMRNQVEFSYYPAKRSLEARGLKGRLDATDYGGDISLLFSESGAPARLTGELFVSNLDADGLLHKPTPGAASSGGAEALTGAPNLTRPTVGPGGKNTADREENTRKKQDGAAPVLAGMSADVGVTVTGLTVNRIPVSKLSFDLRAESGRIAVPFSLETLDGTATGSAGLSLGKAVPVVTLVAAVRGISMEKLCRVLGATGAITGALSADLDVSGRGGSWKELSPTLKGKSSLQVRKGEVRGFSLIPSNLRGIQEAPVDFPFERISGSGVIERGILTSRDITLQSGLLSGAGGGVVNLALERIDLGVDFMIAGQPPAIPVNITGSFSSLSSSVDVRTLMRNTAEGVLRSPETARDILKDAGKLFSR